MKLARFGPASPWNVFGVCDKEATTAVDAFLAKHRSSHGSQVTRMLALLEKRVPSHGPPTNTEISVHLEDGIYRFRKGDLRVFWFYRPNKVVICTHGWLRDKDYDDQIQRAKRVRSDYRSAVQAGDIEIVSRG